MVNAIERIVPLAAVVYIQIKLPAGIVASLNPDELLHPVVMEVQVISAVNTAVGL